MACGARHEHHGKATSGDEHVRHRQHKRTHRDFDLLDAVCIEPGYVAFDRFDRHAQGLSNTVRSPTSLEQLHRLKAPH